MTPNPSERNGPGTESSEQLDRVFRALADPVRRELLRVLSEREANSVDMTWIADRLTGVDSRLETPEQVTVTLVHVHLPLLEDAGLVEYDRRSGTVRYDPQPLVSRALRKAAVIEKQ